MTENSTPWTRIRKSVAPWLFCAAVLMASYGYGYHEGRHVGFEKGAMAMRTAIFDAIERIDQKASAHALPPTDAEGV